jgi:predicted glycosyltransferase involved in capsule biosynthesis
MSKDTKGNHSTTSEDSLLRDLKKMRSWIEKLEQENNEHQREILRLKSLNRRAAEEIRDLDDMIIKSIEDNKVIEYPEEDKAYFAGFSSINLLNRLDGITNGGYVGNYDDLRLEMKILDGWYVAEHPDFYKNELYGDKE